MPFSVVFAGLLFQNGAQALRVGTLQPWAIEWVDACAAVLVVASTVLMVLALALSTVLVRSARRRRALVGVDAGRVWHSAPRRRNDGDEKKREIGAETVFADRVAG